MVPGDKNLGVVVNLAVALIFNFCTFIRYWLWVAILNSTTLPIRERCSSLNSQSQTMLRLILSTTLSVIISTLAFGQTNLDSLKLTDDEIPVGYTKSNNMLCVTPHASSFYNQSDLYDTFLGKVTKKEFQSFTKKGDEGSILYFEFETEFKGQSFLDGLFLPSNVSRRGRCVDSYSEILKKNVILKIDKY